MQPGFDFSAPALEVASHGPMGEPLPPVNGSGRLSKHASYTGAVHATETRSANIVAMRQLWREPRTMQEMAVIMELPLSSICSLKSAIESELEEVDLEVVKWGPGRKPTKRTRWQMKASR